MLARPYQTTALAKARKRVKTARRATLVLPTGAGKTVVAGLWVKERKEKAGKQKRRFLVLQHTKELVSQNLKKVGRISGLKCSVVMGKKNDWSGEVVFANVPTLARFDRLAEMGVFTDLIVDECHHAAAPGWERIIRQAVHNNDKIVVLGMSATPDRSDGKPLPDELGEIVHRIYIQELLDEGHLVPPRAFCVNLGVDAEIAEAAQGSENDQVGVAKILDTPAFNKAVVDQWRARAEHRPTIAFCSTIEHAKNVAAAFIAQGIDARTVDKDTPQAERDATIAAFKAGEFPVLCNCLILTEGFDHTPTSCVIILRAMIHLSTFLQAIGRGMRVVDAEEFPDVIKWDMILLDFAGAAARHSELDEKTSLKHDVLDARQQEEAPARDTLEVAGPASEEGAPEQVVVPILEEINLNRSQFRWTDIHGDGRTLLVSGGHGFAAVLQGKRGDPHRWVAIGRKTATRPWGAVEVLHVGSRRQAFAAAADYIRTIERDDSRLDNRRWLNEPCTAKQAEKLRSYGCPDEIVDILNKYEASCRIVYHGQFADVRKSVLRHLARVAESQEAIAA
ncbi:DEAD/DEAH box helicase [Sphingomonas sp. 3-13AW]|uniref:DEAD/DEAH box helicase n=1 Tax=Sphingomonas sp. 3-13AW TaxID=3050450 RepID=UPI003BB48AED